ncbi:MAG TPA: LysM peptidoglycan-binding domain-containing protein [Propionibacteriaceae bacterium]|nr:LysM peptidoglycan-binding domain-containing protein [Propionibacteriaceae bacterium]
MIRALRAAGAFLVLVLVLAGTPWLLLRWGGLGAVSRIPWRDLLHQPDNGDLLLVTLSLVGWLAWAHIALTVASEAVTVVTRQRVVIPVPGSRWTRPIAGALVAALAGLVLAQTLRSPVAHVPSGGTSPSPPTSMATSTPAGASMTSPATHSTPRASFPAPPSTRDPRADDRAVAAAAAPASGVRTAEARPGSYIVQPGDDLWTLAVTLFDDGLRWRTLATANQLDPEQPLLPGTVLVVPTLSQAEVSRLTGQGEIDSSERTIVVHSGDTLAGLAARHLGAAAHWPALQRANPTLILDPDHLEPGWVLHLPPRIVPGAAPSSLPSDGHASPRHRDPQAAEETADPAVPDDILRSTGTTARDAGPRVEEASLPADSESQGRWQGEERATSGSSAERGAPVERASGADRSHDAHGVVGGLAAAVLAGVGLGLARRRRGQLWGRPLGRRFRPADPPARRFHQALSQLAVQAPEGPTAVQPTTVVVGERHEGGTCAESVTVTLGDVGRLRVAGPPDLVLAAGGGIGTSLACAPWSEGVAVVVVGSALGWLAGLDDPSIEVIHRLDEGLSRLDRLLTTVGDETDGESAGIVVIVDLTGLPTADRQAVVDRFEPRLAGPCHVAVVWLCGEIESPSSASGSSPTVTVVSEERARLSGLAGEFVPNLVSEPARHALVELFDTATRTDTEPAPWWAPDVDPTPEADAQSHADPLRAAGAPQLGTLTALPLRDPSSQGRPATGRLPLARRPATTDLEDAVPPVPEFLATAAHPVLLLLGEVELIGARGPRPTRAVKQCEEYCAWILEHPGRTAVAMTRSLLVAEGTRRSNMSRLRTWLGADDAGDEYLPDAYSGHIRLHPGITTDWEQLRLLISAGVKQAASDALVEALELVRGAPLADAAPGQWHWAEELRIEMSSTIRDIGAVLAGRALEVNDLDLARWAAARSLTAAPEDELLMALRVRTEHLAGNRAEVERLVLHITRQARLLGVDLSDETVTVLQEAMEGRARARRA